MCVRVVYINTGVFHSATLRYKRPTISPLRSEMQANLRKQRFLSDKPRNNLSRASRFILSRLIIQPLRPGHRCPMRTCCSNIAVLCSETLEDCHHSVFQRKWYNSITHSLASILERFWCIHQTSVSNTGWCLGYLPCFCLCCCTCVCLTSVENLLKKNWQNTRILWKIFNPICKILSFYKYAIVS